MEIKMKRTLFLLVCTVFSMATMAKSDMNRFILKSGHIKYVLTGSTVGEEELYWDDYGNKSYKYTKSTTTTKMFGMKNVEETHSLEIIVNDEMWTVNYLDNTGMHGKVPYYDESHAMVEDMTEEEAEKLAKQIIEGMGGKIEGNESIEGYNCDKVTVLGFTSWMYKGLLLKMEGSLLGIESKIMFSEFKPNSAVPASKFVAPSNIEYAPMPDYENQMYDEVDETTEIIETETPKPVKHRPEPIVTEAVEKSAPAAACSFDFFKEAVISVKDIGYKKLAIINTNGTYTATFMKGLGNVFTVTGTPEEKIDKNEFAEYVAFEHNGNYCWYNSLGNGPIIIHLKKHKMYLMIAAVKGATKTTLLNMADKMKF